jgi:hypothetical protein
MNQETAKGAGDTEAILRAWKNKQLQTLEELANKGADITKAKEALNEAVDSKQRKLDSDFQDWYIAGMGYQYEALVKNEDKKLKEVTGNEAKTVQVHAVFAKQKADLDDKVQSNTMNLFKGYLDTMASLAPTLEGQLRLKRQSLDLELKLADAALERQIKEKQINPALADEARAMEAMVAQAKRFNLEMESDKGLSGWAYGRAKSDSQKSTISDMMGSLESGMQSSFSSAWQGFLTHDKKNLAKAGQDIFQGLIGELTKKSITSIFSGIAGMIAPKQSGGSKYGMEPGSGQGIEAAGEGLSKAAAGLNQASVGFNANSLSFGVAAGGLLLSGIGIATNSQFLVIAGTVLQLAGLAIQIYQILATTAELGATAVLSAAGMTLGVAGGGLIAAAVALKVAAAALAVSSILHGGGVIAHSGLLVAHSGLAPDERIIKAQTGEGVIQRSAMATYRSRGISFDDLNNGKIPMGGGGGGAQIGTIHIDARGASKDIDWDHVVRTKIVPGINRALGLHGKAPLGKSYG